MNSSDESAARAGTRSSWRGVAYVLAAATLFAFNGSISKAVLQQALDSTQLVGLRCWVAAAGFALVAVVRVGPASLRIERRELGFIAAYGVIGVAMVQWLYFVSISRMPVSITLLIEFTAPLLIALWVRFVRGEPVRSRVWAGLTLDGLGLLAACTAALSLAVYYLLGEHGVGRRDPWSLAAWAFGIAGLLWALVIPIWRFPWSQLTQTATLSHLGISAPAWVFALYVVLFGTLIPFGLTLLGLREIGAARVGLIATAEPPLAGLVAWPALGEVLSPVQLVGVLVVLTGIVLAETARMHPAEVPPALDVTTS